MATAKKKASKPTARRRATAKTTVQTDRQRAKPDSQTAETSEPTGQEQDLAPAEGSAYSPDELAQLEHDQRVEHNERTGGGTVQMGELDLQRALHNARTGGVTREEIEKELAPTGFKF